MRNELEDPDALRLEVACKMSAITWTGLFNAGVFSIADLENMLRKSSDEDRLLAAMRLFALPACSKVPRFRLIFPVE